MSSTVSDPLGTSVCSCEIDGRSSDIVWNRRQTPNCRGKYDNRILFETRTPEHDRKFHAVKNFDNNDLRLEAGEIHGITTGAQFNIYCADNNDRRVLLGSLRADRVAGFSTSLGFKYGTVEFTIPKDSAAYGHQIHAGEDATVSFAFQGDADLLRAIWKHFQSEKDQAQSPRMKIRIVEMSGDPDVVVMSTDLGGVVLGTMDGICLENGLNRLPYTLPQDVDTVWSTIRLFGEFFWDFRRVNSNPNQHPEFLIEAHWLTDSSGLSGQGSSIPVHGSANLIDDGAIRIDAGHKNALGFTIRNPTKLSFYVWLFAFNMLDLAIGAPFMPRYLCLISNLL